MLGPLKAALFDAVANTAPESLGVAFSGGVDSTLLAKICADLGRKVTLITVGFPGSHDLEFSKKISLALGLPHLTVAIDSAGFAETLSLVRRTINCDNTSHIENCIAYHFISAAARESSLDTVLSANGCDELFCGYNGYRLAYNGGPSALLALMDEKIANELVLTSEISVVSGQLGVSIRQPFLAPKFIEFAKTIPLGEKIHGPDDMVRKHILRRVALEIGVPEESALKPKKALQYGSQIHKHFRMARNGLGHDAD